jgi:hypothetical protein
MRPRFAVPTLLAVLAAVAMPSAAAAHPVHDRGLTIGVTPNPITAGESVLIYGKLVGPNVADQTVTLYHRVNPQVGYSVVSRTTTSNTGFYDFPRADGVVMSNREWFVRGPGTTHSRTVHEKVEALVNLSSSTSATDTNTPVTFTGSVSPTHAGQEILLQVPATYNNGWRTIATGAINGRSQFSVSHRFARPGIETVRALLRSDARNTASPSDSLTVSVQQAQVPGFTINSPSPIIPEGGTTTISGVLDKAGTNVVEPDTEVTLYGNTATGPQTPLATTMTGADGSYSFPNQAPKSNTVYKVKTTLAPARHSAALYEGVSSVLSLSATPMAPEIGQAVTFSGTVSPADAGQYIYLQRQDANGDWYDVGVHVVGAAGAYTFYRVFGAAGAHSFRTRVYGDGENVGGASTPVTINVSGTVAPASTLPPAAS